MQLPQTNCLEISVESGILNLMINNPPNNYLPAEFFEELNRCRDLILSPEVAAVIFTGKGKVFSKGVDIQGITAQSNSLDQSMVVFANKVFTFLSRLEKPVIAAINGACLGGGLELALACHIRLCSEKARIGLPELSIGLIPGLGGIQRLARVVGEAKALEMILLGDMISAARAHDLNLVSRIFPKKDFYAKVLIFVRTILTARREALAEALRLIALSRADKEEGNVAQAAESFARLISQILAERHTGA